MYEVGNYVWIMKWNKPQRQKIYAILEQKNTLKKGTQKIYYLCDSFLGVTLNKCNQTSEKNIYSTKEDLIKSLLEDDE